MSHETENKPGFDTTLRCKAPAALRQRFDRLAKVKTKRVPELYREACVRFVEEQEKALGLPPIEETAKAA